MLCKILFAVRGVSRKKRTRHNKNQGRPSSCNDFLDSGRGKGSAETLYIGSFI